MRLSGDAEVRGAAVGLRVGGGGGVEAGRGEVPSRRGCPRRGLTGGGRPCPAVPR